MQPDQIRQTALLDILFEGRNKNYGAYELRKHYSRRLETAMLCTLSLCLLLIFGYIWAGRTEKKMPAGGPLIYDTVTLLDPIPEMHEPSLPRHVRRSTTRQVATLNDSRPRIVPDDQVGANERPPAVEDLNMARLNTENKDGIPDDNTGQVVPADGAGKEVFTAPAQNTDAADSIFMKVEIESKYRDGPDAWERFLQMNFHPSQEALYNGIQGVVIVKFVVDKTGDVSHVQAISGPEEYRQEAVRVIRNSGQWDPAIQNGRRVSSYKKQPIVILLGSE